MESNASATTNQTQWRRRRTLLWAFIGVTGILIVILGIVVGVSVANLPPNSNAASSNVGNPPSEQQYSLSSGEEGDDDGQLLAKTVGGTNDAVVGIRLPASPSPSSSFSLFGPSTSTALPTSDETHTSTTAMPFNKSNETSTRPSSTNVPYITLTRSPTPSPSLRPTRLPTRSPTASPTTTPPTTMYPTSPQLALRVSSYQVVQTIPHDPNAFTQGFTFDPNESSVIYESTGLYGSSSIRKVDLAAGTVLNQYNLPRRYFGEGLAYYDAITGTTEGGELVLQGRLIHITWREQTGFIIDPGTLQPLSEFFYTTTTNEGWGITYNPDQAIFYVSDGSQYLHIWNTQTLEVIRRFAVAVQFSPEETPQPVYNLNELEWDDATGTILANIWKTDTLVRIDPTSGAVITLYDLSELYPNRMYSADVLNGIAIKSEQEVWITGKKWPSMYQIMFPETVPAV